MGRPRKRKTGHGISATLFSAFRHQTDAAELRISMFFQPPQIGSKMNGHRFSFSYSVLVRTGVMESLRKI